jgi:predicted O-methyltransferase YrrM
MLNNLLKKLGLTRRIVPSIDESLQIQMFSSAGLDWGKGCVIASQTLAKAGLLRTDPSNHYELFAAISEVCSPRSVLEIGTHKGVFTSFLAALWPNAKIVTYELPSKKDLPVDLASESDISRHYVPHFESDAEHRDSLLAKFANIELRLQDSATLMNLKETFDVAWIDGDHRFPLVAFDIANAVRLCRSDGWICVDDIRPVALKASNEMMGSTEGHETVRRIAAAGLANLYLVLKRGQNVRSDHNLNHQKHLAILRTP